MKELNSEEAARAVGGLGKALFGALVDAGLSAASSMTNDEEISRAQQRIRAERRAQERCDRLALVDVELAVLGIEAEAVAGLDERELRRIYRQRSRELHPDLVGDVRPKDDELVPTIYQINEAYETIKKVL